MVVLMAVNAEFRGKRVGCYLIDGAIKRAKEQGYKRFQLNVLAINPAVGFYRAVGLELLAETRAPKPAEFGVPPEYRMCEPLMSELIYRLINATMKPLLKLPLHRREPNPLLLRQ